MGYLHIENLYRPSAQTILMMRECYVQEKVHGTSAHISFSVRSPGDTILAGQLTLHSGGEKYEKFKTLFDPELLLKAFHELGHHEIVVYGEAYGGKQQGMSHTYGQDLHFIVFDVKVNDNWLSVPDAADVADKLGLEFVPWKKVSTDLVVLDTERDAPSEVAIRRGMGNDKIREGIVIRPLVELTTNNGQRIIAKHKRKEFQERQNQPKAVDTTKLEVLKNAQAIADEWVTDNRLRHVMGYLAAQGNGEQLTFGIEDTSRVIKTMIEDVRREAEGEIEFTKEVGQAISRKTAELFKQLIAQ